MPYKNNPEPRRGPEHFPKYQVFGKAQGWLCILHWVSALVFLFIIRWDDWKNDWKVDLELNFNRWDRVPIDGELPEGQCTPRKPCFVNKYVNKDRFARVSLGVMIAMCSFISGAHHLYAWWCYSSRLSAIDQRKKDGNSRTEIPPDRYFDHICSSIVVPRWIDYAFSSPIMFIVVAVLWVSPPDLRDIIYAFSVQFLVILGGYGAEIANKALQGKNDKYYLTAGAWLAYAAVWSYLFAAFSESTGSDGERVCDIAKKFQEEGCTSDKYPVVEQTSADPPDFVYIILFAIFFTFSSFGITHTLKLTRGEPDKFISNLNYEVVYSMLSFTSKICLLGTMASSIVARSDGSVLTGDQTPTPDDEADENAAYIGLGASSVLSLIVGLFFWYFYSKAAKADEYTKNKNTRGVAVFTLYNLWL